MRRTEPKTLHADIDTAEAPTDLVTLTALAAEFPGLGLRLIRRAAYERRFCVYRPGGTILVSRADFAAYLVSGRIEPSQP